MNCRGTFVFSLFGLLSSAACSSIMNGTHQVVTVDSNVRGAQVFVDNTLVGNTPYTGPVKRGCKVLRVQSPGFGDQSVPLNTEVEGWFWGNIILGGFFGSTTDSADGAMYKYAPTAYNVSLGPSGPPPTPWGVAPGAYPTPAPAGYAPPPASWYPTPAPGGSAPAAAPVPAPTPAR